MNIELNSKERIIDRTIDTMYVPFRSAAADPSQPMYAPTNLPSNHRPVSVGLEAIDDNLLNVHGCNVALIIGLGMEREGAQIPKRHRFLWNRPTDQTNCRAQNRPRNAM